MSTAASRKKVKFVAGISVIVVCMLYLVVSGFQLKIAEFQGCWRFSGSFSCNVQIASKAPRA